MFFNLPKNQKNGRLLLGRSKFNCLMIWSSSKEEKKLEGSNEIILV